MPAPMARHPPLLDRRWQYAVGYWIMGFEQGYRFRRNAADVMPCRLAQEKPHARPLYLADRKRQEDHHSA